MKGASEFGTGRHWCSCCRSPSRVQELQGCVKWFQKASTAIEGPHLPCVLQAPAVKVKHRPRRGGGRHACPHCFITLGKQAHVLCTSPCTAFRCLAQVQVHNYHTCDSTFQQAGSNWLAIMHLRFSRPSTDLSFQNIQNGRITSRMPQLQSPLGPLTRFDTCGLLCSPSLLTLR